MFCFVVVLVFTGFSSQLVWSTSCRPGGKAWTTQPRSAHLTDASLRVLLHDYMKPMPYSIPLYPSLVNTRTFWGHLHYSPGRTRARFGSARLGSARLGSGWARASAFTSAEVSRHYRCSWVISLLYFHTTAVYSSHEPG